MSGTPLRRRLPFVALVVVLACIALADLTTYTRWHATPDDGYQQVRTYLAAHALPETSVIVVNGTSEFALRDSYRVGPWTSDGERRRHDVRYLVVPWKEVQQGYTYVSLPDVLALTRQGRLVLHRHERTYGDLDVYQLPVPA